MATKFYNPDSDYLLKHLEEVQILTESTAFLREHYEGKKLKGETVTILSTRALVDDAYELAMYRMEQGYYYAACSILECLGKVKYPKAFVAMANCYRNGLSVLVDMERADELEKKAFSIWNERAATGDAKALFDLGICYRHGEGVPQDNAKAVEYYTLAYKNGYKGAALNLGIMYSEGHGVEKDYTKAYELYNVAAENGVADGFTLMGRHHYYGLGREVNYEKAVELFLKASEDEEGDALYHLGCCYANGLGVKKDDEKAIEYFYRSAYAGMKEAEDVLKKNGLPYPLEEEDVEE